MDLESSKSSQHEARHGQVNHGLARLGLPFVVAAESAVASQPTEGTFHHPAPWQHLEGVQFGALDDFDRAAPQPACPLQQRSAVAAVGPDTLDAPACLLTEERRQQLFGAISVLDVGRQNHHQEHQPDRVDQDVAFAPIDFLACIVAPLVAGFGTLDALTVDDRRAGLSLASFGQAQVLT